MIIKKKFGDGLRVYKKIFRILNFKKDDKMSECSMQYLNFPMKLKCYECKVEYENDYTFLVILGKKDWLALRICAECSHMFYACSCGCEGDYLKCNQRPRRANILVSNLFFYLVQACLSYW